MNTTGSSNARQSLNSRQPMNARQSINGPLVPGPAQGSGYDARYRASADASRYRPASEMHSAPLATPETDALDRWFEDLHSYEATLEEMAQASLDANFKEELSAIEQWFRVLSEAERTAALYSLLQTSTQVQVRFFSTVLQQMSRSDPVSAMLSPGNTQDSLQAQLQNLRLKSPTAQSFGAYGRQSLGAEPYLTAPSPAESAAQALAKQRAKLKARTSAPANILVGASTLWSDSDIAERAERAELAEAAENAESGDSAERGSPGEGDASYADATDTGLSDYGGNAGSHTGVHINEPGSQTGPQTDAATLAANTNQQLANLIALQQQMTLNMQAAVAGMQLSPQQLAHIQQQQQQQQHAIMSMAGMAQAAQAAAQHPQSHAQHGLLAQPAPMGASRRSPRIGATSPHFTSSSPHFASPSPHFPTSSSPHFSTSPRFGATSPNPRAANTPRAPLNNAVVTGVGSGTNPDEPLDMNLLADVPTWLRSLRLHKYTPNFEQYTWQEMVRLDDAALESAGVSALGARRKLLKVFATVREKTGESGGGEGEKANEGPSDASGSPGGAPSGASDPSEARA